MKATITDDFVRARRKVGYVGDALMPGLRLRVTRAGKKVWVWTYRPRDGSPVASSSIGTFPEVKVEEARARVAALRAKVRAGENPQAELVASRKRARLPLATLLDKFTEARKAEGLSRKTMEAYRQLWLWTKPLHDREANAIKRSEVAALIDSFAGKKTAGNRVLIYLRQVYRWAALRDLVHIDPTLGLKRKKESARERSLTIGEIIDLLSYVWLNFDWPVRLGIYLLVVTGQRVSECLDMTWEELDFSRCQGSPHLIANWLIPAQRRKVKMDHLVPLPPTVVIRLLSMSGVMERGKVTLHHVAGRSIPKRTGRVLTIKSGGRERWQRKIREGLANAGIRDFQLRDLRRTAATEGFANAGAEAQTITRILGHVGHAGGRQTATYDRNARIPEARKAIEAWAQKLEPAIRIIEVARNQKEV
jgi:integrase